MKFTGPVVKKSRSLGIALTPKAARIMQNRPSPPGQHGVTSRRRKRSDYGMQLLEKQRLRFQYNISEKQMRNYLAKANKMQGNTGVNLVQLLESRLDAFVLRAGLAPTIYAARQYVRHGHLTVNGRRVNMPGQLLRPNDMVAVREKSRKLTCFHDALRNAHPPDYIALFKSDLSAKLLFNPEREDVPIICNVNLVIEYYSR